MEENGKREKCDVLIELGYTICMKLLLEQVKKISIENKHFWHHIVFIRTVFLFA